MTQVCRRTESLLKRRVQNKVHVFYIFMNAFAYSAKPVSGVWLGSISPLSMEILKNTIQYDVSYFLLRSRKNHTWEFWKQVIVMSNAIHVRLHLKKIIFRLYWRSVHDTSILSSWILRTWPTETIVSSNLNWWCIFADSDYDNLPLKILQNKS